MPCRISEGDGDCVLLIASCASSRPTPLRTAVISTFVLVRKGR